MSLQRYPREDARLWTFAEFTFDELRFQLCRGNQPVELESKPLELLRQLLLRAGEVVTKQELLDAVWPGLMVVDGSVATAVSKLRKALDDRDARMILTVSRVGYRMAVPVDCRPAGPMTSEPSQAVTPTPTEIQSPPRSRPRLLWITAAVIVCTVALALVFLVRRHAQPKESEARSLYLRSLSLPLDPEPSRLARQMLERSVQLEPNFAPAWLMLSRRYYVESRYATGRDKAMLRYEAALERSHALDPNYIPASASLITFHVENGALTKALAEAHDLVRRRPDSADAHYSLSYALRYGGFLDQAAMQCDIAFLLDPHTQSSGLRSCAVVFLLASDYHRAMDFVRLDNEGSTWRKALTVHILLRQGKVADALRIGPSGIPQWQSWDMLLACAAHHPAADIDRLAASIAPSEDAETDYFAASHLAYCGRSSPALALLQHSIHSGYCAYPALTTDPFFASLRSDAAFETTRTAAAQCQAALVPVADRMISERR